MYAELRWDGFEARARPAMEAYLATLKGFRKNAFEPLSDEQRAVVNRRWGESFGAFGYRMSTRNGPVAIHHQ